MSEYQDAEHIIRCMRSSRRDGNAELYYIFKGDLQLLYPTKYREVFGNEPVYPVQNVTVNKSSSGGLLGLGVGLLLGGIFFD
jgi:hypothetical protein